MKSWPMLRIDGAHGFKLVPCRFPPIRHFQRIAAKRDWDMLEAVAAMTDDQARDEIGQLELVFAKERAGQSRAAPVMAAFSNIEPRGSLFSDGNYGVLYLQMQEDNAIVEAQHEISAFLEATHEKPTTLRRELYSIALAGDVADLRGLGAIGHASPPGGTAETRALGARLRAAGAAGALYANAPGVSATSLAVFATSMLGDCRRSAIIAFDWDGRAVSGGKRQDAMPAQAGTDAGRGLIN